jgi:peptide chain release factor 3
VRDIGQGTVHGLALDRLEPEFGAPVELSPTRFRVARRTDEASRAELRSMQGVDVLERSDGELLAVFESTYWLDRLEAEHPELTLDRLIAEGELHQQDGAGGVR